MAVINKTARFRVLQRDGFKCVYCGATANTGATLEVDHIVPRSAGGSNEESNLAASCRTCNGGKSATSLGDTECVRRIREKLSVSEVILIEAYCESSCSCREITIYVKDYDGLCVPAMLKRGGVLKCPVCLKPLKLHWVKTAAERAREEDEEGEDDRPWVMCGPLKVRRAQ